MSFNINNIEIDPTIIINFVIDIQLLIVKSPFVRSSVLSSQNKNCSLGRAINPVTKKIIIAVFNVG